MNSYDPVTGAMSFGGGDGTCRAAVGSAIILAGPRMGMAQTLEITWLGQFREIYTRVGN